MKFKAPSKYLLPSFFALAMGITAASGANTVIYNDFDGVADDTGPSWASSTFNGSFGSTTGDISVNGGANNNGVALYTSTTVDVSSASSFTITWDIGPGSNLFNGSNPGVWHTGLFFGVAGSNLGTGIGWDLPTDVFGVLLLNGGGGTKKGSASWEVVDRGNGNFSQYALSGSAPTQASIEDGFSLSITLNSDNSYEVTSTGLSNTSTSTGSLIGTRTSFSALAPSLKAYNSVEGGGVTYTVNSVTLTTPVPEPSTLALLALGSLCLVVRRRA